MLPETVASLSAMDNIVGIKEATADMELAAKIRRLCGDDFALMSGDDATTLPFLSIGGDGVVSVAAGVVPGEMAALCNACLDGDFAEAKTIHYRLLPLFTALFLETNPIPVKAALHMMGKMSDEIRLPLTELSHNNAEQLRAVLLELGIIET